MSNAVNFSSLSPLATISDTDQLLVRLDNSLSGASGFGRIAKSVFNSVDYLRQVTSTTSPNDSTNVYALSVNSPSTNVDFAILPKGTGALLAEIPDSSVAEGNKRGPSATDWQRQRVEASQVASGSSAVIGGGYYNTASSSGATVAGGGVNTASETQSTVGGGALNTASGIQSTICGGYSNIASNQKTFIGGGHDNRVTGYAAAVCGGWQLSATGDYSVVGGGYQNIASNTYATVGGGGGNNSTNTYATVGGGQTNTASGAQSTIGGGGGNIASGNYTIVNGGRNNTAAGEYSIASGYDSYSRLYGQFSQSSGIFNVKGDAQYVRWVVRNSTTGTTTTSAALLFLDGLSSRITLQPDYMYSLNFKILGTKNDGITISEYNKRAIVRNIGGTLSAVNVVDITTPYEGNNLTDADITIDSGTSSVNVAVTGIATETWRWISVVDGVEMKYSA